MDVFGLEDICGNRRNCRRLFAMVEREQGSRKGYISLGMLEAYTVEAVRRLENKTLHQQGTSSTSSSQQRSKSGGRYGNTTSSSSNRGNSRLWKTPSGESTLATADDVYNDDDGGPHGAKPPLRVTDDGQPICGEGVQRYSHDVFSKSLRSGGPADDGGRGSRAKLRSDGETMKKQARLPRPEIADTATALEQIETSHLSVIDEVEDDDYLSSPGAQSQNAKSNRNSPKNKSRGSGGGGPQLQHFQGGLAAGGQASASTSTPRAVVHQVVQPKMTSLSDKSVFPIKVTNITANRNNSPELYQQQAHSQQLQYSQHQKAQRPQQLQKVEPKSFSASNSVNLNDSASVTVPAVGGGIRHQPQTAQNGSGPPQPNSFAAVLAQQRQHFSLQLQSQSRGAVAGIHHHQLGAQG
eukprot:g20496.t1